MNSAIQLFQQAASNGSLAEALKRGQDLLEIITDSRVRRYIFRNLQKVAQQLKERGYRTRAERLSVLPNRYEPGNPLSYNYNLPQPNPRPPAIGMKRKSDNRASGSAPNEGNKPVVSSFAPVVETVESRPGLCVCPSKTYGSFKSNRWALQRRVLDRTYTKLVNRFQSLRAATDLADPTSGLSYPLSHWKSGTGIHQLPFYCYRVDAPAQAQIFIPKNAGDVNILARPKVCYRLHMRDSYSYDDDVPIQPMFYWEPYDADINRNAPDNSTQATINNYKIEYTTKSLSNYPKIRDYLLGWVEAQVLIRQNGTIWSHIDNPVVHTGFMKFAPCGEPPKAWYNADLTSSEERPPVTAEEAIAMDSWWLRFFNKKVTHPLMRSGGGYTKLKPIFFNTQRHCLNHTNEPAMIQSSVRYNVGKIVSTSDYADIMMGAGVDQTVGIDEPVYVQVTQDKGYDAFPKFGDGLWFFVYTSQFGPPAAVPPDHASVPSFDIMLRTQITTVDG